MKLVKSTKTTKQETMEEIKFEKPAHYYYYYYLFEASALDVPFNWW